MLPYHTLEEAEEALGRGLTLAEKMWLKYTAQKPDYILHCHNTLFLFLFYSILPLPYVFIEQCLSNYIRKYKIQPNIKRSFSDMFICYKDVMLTFVLTVGPLQVLSYPTLKKLCQIMVYFMVEDFSHYWLHRMLHCKWAYNKIHRVHHEYTALIELSAPYAHWAEVLIPGLGSFIGPLIVPCHMVTYWLWFVFRQMEAIETHSGYDIPWCPTKYIPFYGGSEYRDYHHFVGGKSQSNFASVFTYCDYIYGTDKGYRYKKQILRQIKDKTTNKLKENGKTN